MTITSRAATRSATVQRPSRSTWSSYGSMHRFGRKCDRGAEVFSRLRAALTLGVLGIECMIEPRARVSPVAVGRASRDTQDAGRFLLGQAGEESQLDELRASGLLFLEIFK